MFYTPLRPCEYCGGEATIIVRGNKRGGYSKYVECKCCGSRSGTYTGQWNDEDSWNSAEIAWNSRKVLEE